MTPIKLTERQIDLLRVLWRQGPMTASAIGRALKQMDGEQLAPTTIATMLARLKDKGAVTSAPGARGQIYSAAVSETAVKQSVIGSVADRLFGGDRQALLAHLVADEGLAEDDLKALTDQIAEARRDRGEG